MLDKAVAQGTTGRVFSEINVVNQGRLLRPDERQAIRTVTCEVEAIYV